MSLSTNVPSFLQLTSAGLAELDGNGGVQSGTKAFDGVRTARLLERLIPELPIKQTTTSIGKRRVSFFIE